MWTSNHENTKYNIDPPINKQSTNGHILTKAGAISLPCKSRKSIICPEKALSFFIDPVNPAYVI